MKQKPLYLSLIAAGVIGAVALPVHAQLEEVVVTARKRQESMQDTPLAVSSIGKDTIENSFLGDATGIAQFAPNVVFDEIAAGTPGGGGISIRGLSYQDVEKTFDPTVLIYLDGVPVGTNTGNAMNLLDIERIEVLRGPQGTLFGRNAVGGVINIHRTKPILGEWAGKVRSRIESEDDATSLEGVLNVPLGETLAAKINVARIEKPDFYQNVTLGKDEGGSDDERIGVHLLWEPTSELQIEAQYNRSEMDGTLPPMLAYNSPQAAFCAGFGACAASPDTPISGNRRKGSGDLPQDFFLDSEDYQLDINWAINDRLSAVVTAAHRNSEEETFLDFDGSPLEIFHVRRSSDYEQDSFEARFDYDDGDRLSLTAGYFYWNAKVKNWENDADISLLLGLPLDGCGFDSVSCQLDTANAESDSDSFFFEGDYRLTDSLYVVLGARYIEETKKLAKAAFLPVFGATTLPLSSGERTDDELIHRIGLRWEPADDIMTYATWSTGFRSGGFSIRAVTPEILAEGFEPETVDNFELGIKTTLLDQRLRLNATVFHMEYDNMQLEQTIPRPGPGSGNQDAVLNAGGATINGVELEVTALLPAGFTLDFNAGYLDAEYDEFRGQIFADGAFDDDNSDLELRRAPKWNYTAALNYGRDIGGGALSGRISYNWTDDYEGTLTNFEGTQVEAFGLLDVSMSYRYNQWRIGVYGRNLTDEDEYSHTFAVVPERSGASLFGFNTPRPPRVFGLEATYTFGNY
ncbi:MAG: TonB-dependent receptor [Chromatocurvus sp.]